jgi:hypothetical protein
MSVCDNHKIQYSNINDIKKKCRNMIIYYVRVIEFINEFQKKNKNLKDKFIKSKNCFNSNENLIKGLKENINELLYDINNNSILSKNLYDYKLTYNVLDKDVNLEDYFKNMSTNEIHNYKDKFFLEFIFNRNLNYLHSLPLITINYDESNIKLVVKIFRKFMNGNENKYFELTNFYEYMDDKDYIDVYNYNLNYIKNILDEDRYFNIVNYLKLLLNEIEAIYNVTEIIT